MKPIRNPFLAAIATGAALLTFATFSFAASFYWDADSVTAENQNGSGTWDTTTTNWTATAAVDDSAPNIAWVNGSENTAFLGNTSGAGYTNPADGGTITLAETISLFSLSMSNGQSGPYIINGGEGITLNLVGTNPSIGNNSTSASLTINAVISGNAGLTKINNGRVILTAANTYTGNTTLTAGVLEVGAMNSGALTPAGLIFNGGVLQGNGTFTYNFNNTGLASAADGELAGPSGGFSAKGGPLTVNFGGASAQVTLSGPSNRFGNGFTLGSSSADSKVTVVNPIALNGAIRTFTANAVGDFAELSGVLSGTATAGVNKAGTGSLTLSAANTYGGATTVGAGSLVISNATALGSPTPAVVTNTSVSDGARLVLIGGVVTDANESLTIAGTGGTINAGPLHAGDGGGTWSGPITLGATAARIGATPGNTLTVTGSIASGTTNNLSISGQGDTGVVVLKPTTSNTYTGTTSIARGILRLGKTDALPVTTVLDAKDALNAPDVAVFDMAGFNQTIAGLIDTGANANDVITNSSAATTSTLTINNNAARVFDGTIQDGNGTVALTKSGTAMQTLTGANTYSGTTLISVGALGITHNDGLGSTAGETTVAVTGTTSTGGRLVVSNNITCPENITLTGASEVSGGYNASIESSSGTNSLDGSITLAGTGGQRINSTGTPGSLTLNGTVTRDGANAGILVLRTGNSSATLTVNNTIDLNGAGINVQGQGSVFLNSPAVDVNSVAVSFGGPSLALVLGVDDALPGNCDLYLGSSNATAGNDLGDLDLAGHDLTVKGLHAIRSSGTAPSEATERKVTNTGGVLSTLTAGNGTTAGNTSTFDGVIEDGEGGVALTKTGAGTLVLTAENTYTGATTVDDGILRVNGSLAAGSAVSVAEAGTLAGTGSVGGPVTGAGVIAPGSNGTGTLTTGQASLGGTLAIEIDGDNADKLVSTGAVNLSGPLDVTLLGGGFTQTSYVIAEGSSLTGAFSSVTAGYSVSYTATQAILSQAVSGNPYDEWIDSAAFNTPPLSAAQKLPDADPDNDGTPNLIEFALNGNPADASNNGALASLLQDASAPAGRELTLILAARDGAAFAGGASATVDGLTYTVEGSLNLAFPGSAVSSTGPSDTAPAAAGLPDLTGTAWEYHTFKLDASEGLSGKGFLRLKVAQP